MKTCSKCGVEKDESEYYPKRGKCKACLSESGRAYRIANKEHRAAVNKAYRDANREKISAQRKEYYQANRQSICEYQLSYRQSNEEKCRARSAKYREANREKLRAWHRQNYYNVRKGANAAYRKQYERRRRRTDPLYRLKGILRNHAKRSLAGYGKNTKTERLLGMAFVDFFALWEARCEAAGLTVSDAVVDHLVPLAAAKTKTEAELMSHWSNLQPLTAEENAVKSDNMTPAIERRYNEIRGVAWLLDALQGD